MNVVDPYKGILLSTKKKGNSDTATAGINPGRHMVSKISQLLQDRYRVISLA
jgi:hypothetical protein